MWRWDVRVFIFQLLVQWCWINHVRCERGLNAPLVSVSCFRMNLIIRITKWILAWVSTVCYASLAKHCPEAGTHSPVLSPTIMYSNFSFSPLTRSFASTFSCLQAQILDSPLRNSAHFRPLVYLFGHCFWAGICYDPFASTHIQCVSIFQGFGRFRCRHKADHPKWKGPPISSHLRNLTWSAV